MKNLHHETNGQGEAVVLVHSGVTDSRMWDKQWDVLAKQYQVIRYDRPGYGKSAASEEASNTRANLLALLDKLGIEKAHLVGCSMGGEISVDFALEHPERVRSLSIISSLVSGFEMQGEPPAELMMLFGALQEGKIEEAARLTTKVFLVGEQRQEADVPEALREAVYEISLNAMMNGGFMQADAQPLEPPAMQRLGEIAVPTMLMVGDCDNPAILQGAKEIQQKIAGAKLLEIPNAAHFPNMEAPELFNEALLEFLAEQ